MISADTKDNAKKSADHSGNISILIVDDTEPNVRLLAHVLKKEGYRVMAAFSGPEALELVRKRRPDMVLLDVMMPEMNGFEVCRKLKEEKRFRDIPVIFLSALSEADSKVKGFDAGGVDYITKPFQREEVIARIELHVRLKKLEKELSEKVDQLKEREQNLEKLNREKDELIRIVGHDFRNPVTGIMGLAGFLKQNGEGLDDEARSEMLGSIESSGQRLLHLVNGLLTKDEHESVTELILSDIDPVELANNVIDLHRPTAINKNIRLETEFSEVSAIRLDRHKVEQIISNLLSNALKFTPDNGEISLKMAPLDEAMENEGEGVQFTIQDSGVGIPAEQLNDIWKDNKKYIRNGTSGEQGSGMGLGLVKSFTELHGGTISVDSKQGEGTSFTVRLFDQSR